MTVRMTLSPNAIHYDNVIADNILPAHLDNRIRRDSDNVIVARGGVVRRINNVSQW